MANRNDKFKKKRFKDKDKDPKFSPEGKFGQGSASKSDADRADSDGVKHKFNDVSWYAKNEQMLKDAADYSYNNPLGTPLPINELFNSGAVTSGGIAVPGLMAFRTVNACGVSIDAASPANIAAQNIYSFVRYMNSGAKNYDQADLMLYLLGMDNMYSYWNWLKRMYGYARQYSQYNKYMPLAYAAADHLDLEDLRNNLADFRQYLNTAAAQITSFCVPSVMPLFVRHSWMYSNIYADSDILKAQQYMFSPKGFFKYSETDSQYGGTLNFVEIPAAGSKWTEFAKQLDNMINAMGYSEDVGIMSGDILKAYGSNQLFKLDPVDPDYSVLPVYNEEVLNQMHNSNVCAISTTTDIDIKQDPSKGFLIWNPLVPTPTGFPFQKSVMINMPWDNVTPANTMVATRLITLCGINGIGNTRIGTSGSEIVVSRDYYLFKRASSTSPLTLDANVVSSPGINFGFTTFGTWQLADMIAVISNFDWHPLVPLYGTKPGSGPQPFHGFLGDISNYTVISGYNIEKMHLTAIMSEFNIPQLGSF